MNNIRFALYRTFASLRDHPHVQILVFVMMVGACLRFYGIQNEDNTDEYNEVVEALRVASGNLNINRWHKKGFQNILAIEYGFYFVTGYLIGLWKSTIDFAANIVRDLQPLFLIGRYTTATMGTLSVVLLYFIGCRLYNPRVALVASLLLAVCSMHVWTSHVVGTDVPLTFFFLLALFFITRFYSSGERRDYCFAAILAAVAINIKIIGIGIGFIYVLAHLMKSRRTGQTHLQAIRDKNLLYGGVCFVVGLLVSNPAILVGFKQWVMSFIWQYGIYTNVYDEVPYALNDNGFYTYAILLYKEFGPVLTIMTLAAVIAALIRRTDWDIIFLCFAAAMYLILGNTTFLVQNRYLMTILPALFLLDGVLLESCASMITSRWKQVAITIALVVVASAYPFYNSVAYALTLTEENTSTIAKRWIEENIPRGSKILIDGGHTILTSGPRLNQSREKLEEQLNAIRSLKEGETYDSPQVKIVDSYSSIYFELLLKNMPEVTYDLTTTELGRMLEPIEYYQEHGFQYIVHNGDLDDRLQDQNWRTKYPMSVAFYESLDDSFQLIKTFSPSRIRSGPTIKIYKVR